MKGRIVQRLYFHGLLNDSFRRSRCIICQVEFLAMSMAAKKTRLIVKYDLSSYACCYRHSHFKIGIQLFWNIEYESVF